MMNGKRAANLEIAGAETGAGILNRTGASLAPEMALDLIREAQRTPPGTKGDSRLLADYRLPYIKEMAPIGSRPLPRDSGSAGPADRLLLDKLGERLAFERQGVRLYECLIGKVKALGEVPGGPSLEDLGHILGEELAHFRFLREAILQAGGDPTVKTPCADIAAVLSQGVVQVVSDPRTTVVQCLEAVLTAELADNEGWSLLKSLVRTSASLDLADQIEEAEEHEQEHLAMVRGWLTALVIGEASGTGRASRPSTSTPAKAASKAKAVVAAAVRAKPKAGRNARKPVSPSSRKTGRR